MGNWSGADMRCPKCNKYLPDRCTCNGPSIEEKRMAEQNNQAERAAPCPLCNSDQVQICRDANNTAKDTARCRECKCTGMLSIWNRRAAIPAAVDAVDLPEGTKAAKFAPHTIVYTAEQVQMAIAADRRKQAMTQPASIDTPEFRDLLLDYAVDWRDGEDTDRKINNLIAYIDGRTAGAAVPEKAAPSIPDGFLLVGPGEIRGDLDAFSAKTMRAAERLGNVLWDVTPSHQSPGKEGA